METVRFLAPRRHNTRVAHLSDLVHLAERRMQHVGDIPPVRITGNRVQSGLSSSRRAGEAALVAGVYPSCATSGRRHDATLGLSLPSGAPSWRSPLASSTGGELRAPSGRNAENHGSVRATQVGRARQSLNNRTGKFGGFRPCCRGSLVQDANLPDRLVQ